VTPAPVSRARRKSTRRIGSFCAHTLIVRPLCRSAGAARTGDESAATNNGIASARSIRVREERRSHHIP
jgi:hypothetical protein